MASGGRPTRVQVLAAGAGLVLIMFFLFGGGSDEGEDEPGINERAAANIDNAERPQLVQPPPAPTYSAAQMAYLSELKGIDPLADVEINPGKHLDRGADDCDSIPDTVPAAPPAPGDFDPYASLTERLGRVADSLWDQEWKDRIRIAATHLCPARKPVYDRAVKEAVPNVDDGTHEVGVEIPAGTYRITDPDSNCYWERTATDGDIRANDFVTVAKQIDVRLGPGDAFFTSKGCGVWFKVG
jgi:hypothetical protein